MDAYERNVRGLLKSITDFFDTRGANAADLDKRIRWLEAYHSKLDKERSDKADKLQTTLF